MERSPGSDLGDTQSGGETQATEAAKQQAQQVTQQTQQKAGQLADQGRQQVKSQLATQKDQAAERLSPIRARFNTVGQAIRFSEAHPERRIRSVCFPTNKTVTG